MELQERFVEELKLKCQLLTNENLALRQELVTLKTEKANSHIFLIETMELLEDPLYLHKIIALAPGHVFWHDVKGTILGCNNNQARFMRYSSPQELLGKSLYEVVPKEEAEKLLANNQHVISSGVTLTLEEEMSNPDGMKRKFFVQKVPLKNVSGEVVGVLGASLDITDLKNAQEEINKIKGMGAIGSSIAHELRTPLGSILSIAKGLKRFFPILLDGYLAAETADLITEKIRQNHIESLLTSVEDIESEVHSANTIINMLLLNIKQLEVKQEDFELCSISECIYEAVSRYPFVSESQAELIHLQLENDFQFQGKHLLIVHVFFNLIKNALYAIQSAGKGCIKVWVNQDEDIQIVYFEDTAKGISKEMLPKLFTRFFTTSLHGTGLGLAFCKMTMQALGGDISCESIEGEYVRFKLAFPKALLPL